MTVPIYDPARQGSRVFDSVLGSARLMIGEHQAIMELIAIGALPASEMTALPATGSPGQIVYIQDTGTAAGQPNGDAVLSRWDTSLTIPAWVSMLGPANNQWAKFYISSLGSTPSQTLTFNQATPSASWAIAHNFGSRPIVQVWDATFANLIQYPTLTNIAHPTVNSCVLTFSGPVAGNAILVTTTTAGISAGSPFAGMTSN